MYKWMKKQGLIYAHIQDIEVVRGTRNLTEVYLPSNGFFFFL